MPTARLYFDDPLRFDFEAQVVAHAEHRGRPSLLLDRTAFYPEGGGQLPDAGLVGELAVVDVQVDDAGEVHHVLAGALPPVGARVSGQVERARRRRHMAEHSAQHLLSRALVEVARAETVSARLGESACTIDVDRPDLGEAELARAESLAWSLIEDDLPIRAFFPSVAELAALPLRRAPKVDESIRVVQIGDFDVTPCGGTHCTRTAQIGLLRVVASERYKGGTRVTFAAGAPARELLAGESSLLRALARRFSCGPAEIGAAVERLERELALARGELGKTRARLAEANAAELLSAARGRGESTVIAQVDGASPELLRVLGARVTEQADAVAILAGASAEGLRVLVARGAASAFDCGAFLKQLAHELGGRGGGRAERAEGLLPAGIDFETKVRALLER